MEPVSVTVVVLAIGLVVQKFVERVRARFPRLDGELVTLASVLIGTGIAWGWDLRAASELIPALGGTVTIPVAFDYIVTGGAIGAGAGFLADLSGRSGSRNTAVINIEPGGEIEA